MMFAPLSKIVLLLGSLSVLVAGQANDTPDVNVQTTFPNNAFSRVSNGQANRVVFTITQPRSGPDSDRILTLESITGAFLNREKEGKKGYVMRNMTTTKVKSLALQTKDRQPLQVPFDFFPEFKPQQLGVEFRLLIKDAQTSKVHNIHAYTGSVTLVEPPKSWLDIQMLSLYAFLLAIVGTTVYWASQNYPGSRSINKRKQRNAAAKAPSAKPAGLAKKNDAPAAATTTAASYDEDWIPAHHLRKSAGGANSPKPRANRTTASARK